MRSLLTVSALVLAGVCCPLVLSAQVPDPGNPISWVILARHAEKACTQDDDPPLSQAGHRRAGALVHTLGMAKVGTVITTDFRRTYETAAPLAQTLALEPVRVKLKDDPSQVSRHVSEVVDKVKSQKGNTILVVGHTITLPAIIAGLGAPAIGTIGEDSYSNLFVLTTDRRPRVMRLRYGAADPAPDPACS